eukprot:scaffold36514_cov160-Amphora_coffeaeformis.AAC.2
MSDNNNCPPRTTTSPPRPGPTKDGRPKIPTTALLWWVARGGASVSSYRLIQYVVVAATYYYGTWVVVALVLGLDPIIDCLRRCSALLCVVSSFSFIFFRDVFENVTSVTLQLGTPSSTSALLGKTAEFAFSHQPDLSHTVVRFVIF